MELDEASLCQLWWVLDKGDEVYGRSRELLLLL